MEPIFASRSYKKYLCDLIASHSNNGRGIRKQLAQSIGCQVAYITHVLSGEAHFSPEQAEASARFFHFGARETKYFMLLLAHNRAGTVYLQKYYERQLEEQRSESRSLKKRLKIGNTVNERFQHIYYSSWHYAAIHMALLSPGTRTPLEISKKLAIPPRKVKSVLDFLVEQKLVTKNGLEFNATKATLHLDKNSPLISKHHANWRLRAMQALEDPQPESLQYSGVISCGKKDIEKIHEKLSKCLEECVALIKESPSEELVAMNFDLFSLISPNASSR